MAAENNPTGPVAHTRLMPCFLAATENGPETNVIMLCEVLGDQIQSISLRVASDMLSAFPAKGTA